MFFNVSGFSLLLMHGRRWFIHKELVGNLQWMAPMILNLHLSLRKYVKLAIGNSLSPAMGAQVGHSLSLLVSLATVRGKHLAVSTKVALEKKVNSQACKDLKKKSFKGTIAHSVFC